MYHDSSQCYLEEITFVDNAALHKLFNMTGP